MLRTSSILLSSPRACSQLQTALPAGFRVSLFEFRPTSSLNSNRITFLDDPSHLNPIESYSCKKQGRATPSVRDRTAAMPSTCRAHQTQSIENPATLSPFPACPPWRATLSELVKHKSCVCHSYKKHPGVGYPSDISPCQRLSPRPRLRPRSIWSTGGPANGGDAKAQGRNAVHGTRITKHG
jgi:hypothetical protein